VGKYHQQQQSCYQSPLPQVPYPEPFPPLPYQQPPFLQQPSQQQAPEQQPFSQHQPFPQPSQPSQDQPQPQPGQLSEEVRWYTPHAPRPPPRRVVQEPGNPLLRLASMTDFPPLPPRPNTAGQATAGPASLLPPWDRPKTDEH
jgi:hypothetical protein